MRELTSKLAELALAAQGAGVALTVDAEEADRLELSLAIFAEVFRDATLKRYAGLGLAVQAYQKRAPRVLEWLAALARGEGRMVPVRLVKGAYWDSEIKRAQELGLDDYPVFTRKCNTDVSYLACAKVALTQHDSLYPQFATHNAHTVAWLLEVGAGRPFELQRLHGMGEELYGELLARPGFAHRCRVYAPVGSHEHLLPYLVRRLLENGANTSFVNRLVQAEAGIDEIVADPVAAARGLGAAARHPRIALPRDLFAPARQNSRGINLASGRELDALAAALGATQVGRWRARPRIEGEDVRGVAQECRDPADQRRIVGVAEFADAGTARRALDVASAFAPRWNETPAAQRAAVLKRAAALVEADYAELVARCVAETGKTVPDSLAEVREAVDLLRYYAAECERLLSAPKRLPGPTGERNELELLGRGVFLCVSPWNFPLAIFTGQVAAALAAGNTVIAKPAEQGTLVAARAVALLEQAGIPAGALQFLPGDGRALGEALLGDARVAGVAFTGSVETARAINSALAAREGALATLIAETGGVNAMIVDSSALPEQVVRDAVTSAFNSAGQRCSALRLLCLPENTADEILRMLCGAIDELVVGDPQLLATDVGPVIDADAHRTLTRYIGEHERSVLHRYELGAAHEHGLFVAPTVIELPRPAALDARGLRARAARRALRPQAARRARRRDQRARLRAHARRPHAHRFDGEGDRAAGPRRQRLREPQHDRRGRRRAAVRRHGAVGHGAEGRRAALPAAVRHGAHGHDEHGRRRRQRDAAVARRRPGVLTARFGARGVLGCSETVQSRVVYYADPANLLALRLGTHLAMYSVGRVGRGVT